MTERTAIDSALDALTRINTQAISSELDSLRAIKAWALQQLALDYQVGDRVRIIDDYPSSVERGHGWYHYREALAPGQTGIVSDIHFNASRGVWQACIGMDRTWSVSDEWSGEPTRYWNGPACETPNGYVPPSAFDQERHPEGKVKHFYMNVAWVERASA